MNKGKILIITIGIVALLGIIFIFYKIIFNKTTTNFQIILFDKNIDQNDINKMVDIILDDSKPNDFDLSIKYNGNESADTHIKYKEFSNDKENKNNIMKTIDSIINSFKEYEIAPKDIHIHIEEFARILSNIKEKTTIILAGKFPLCYGEEEVQQSLDKLSKDLYIKDNSLIKIYWMLNSNNDEPERKIYDYLKNLGISVIDNQISAENRVCPQDNKNLYAVFFNPIDSANISNFEKLIVKEFGVNIDLKIWNDSPNNGKIIVLDKDSVFNNEDRQLLSSLSKGQWTSIGYLFKQAANDFSSMPDSIEKKLMIVGNLPLESKGNQLDPTIWKMFSKINNFKSYFCLKDGKKQSLTDKAIYNGLKNNKVEIKELQF